MRSEFLPKFGFIQVGDIFKVTIKGSVYTGRIKAIGMKSLMEKYLGLLSQAIKNSSGEPELDFPCSSSSRDSTLSEKRRSRVLESDDETDGEVFISIIFITVFCKTLQIEISLRTETAILYPVRKELQFNGVTRVLQ